MGKSVLLLRCESALRELRDFAIIQVRTYRLRNKRATVTDMRFQHIPSGAVGVISWPERRVPADLKQQIENWKKRYDI